ncbi:MAG: hypothetical protein F6J93_18285 [Oscillatoria sp. SIO1A7]|nr:hypothetical protein [Oscillatoria sp. SIO1A7]
MAEGSKEDTSGIVPQSDSSGSSIQLSEQSDLVSINELVKQGKTPQEIREYLELNKIVLEQNEIVLEQGRRQTEQKADLIRLEEAQKEISFSRKLTIEQKIRTIVGSAAAVAVGLYLINNSPLFGVLILILGVAKMLDYFLAEVLGLFEKLSETRRQPPSVFYGDKRKYQDEGIGGRDEN